MIFAQVTTPMPDPFGGWGSLILQGGAFMLLSYVVIYLAPKMLKEAREERETRDSMFQKTLDGLQQRFEERNDKIVNAVEKQTVTLAKSLSDSSVSLTAAVLHACKHRD